MRASFAAVLAFAAAVFAQTEGFAVVSKPTKGEKVPAGSTYEVVFAPNAKWTGTATVVLMAGDSDKALQLVTPAVATGVDVSKGSFEWNVASTLGDKAVYGLQITLDSDKTVYQYSFPFQIVGSGSGSSASGSASGSASVTVTDKSTASQTTLSSSIITPPSNLSTTAANSQTTVAFTSTGSNGNGGASGATKTSTSAPGSTNAAAPNVGGSTLALFGGLAMAIFAL